MARVTVEDCVEKIPNRFELVLLAGQRSRDLAGGAPLSIERDNDKNPVVALREIAESKLSLDVLRNSLIKGMQKTVEADEPEEEITELLAEETNMLGVLQDDGGDDFGGDDEGDAEEEIAPVDLDEDI